MLDGGRPGSSPPEVLDSPALARDLRAPAAARRRRLVGRAVAGCVLAVGLVAGVATVLGGEDAGTHERPVPPVPPQPLPPIVAAPARVPENLETGRLGGEWRTAVLTRRDVAARLRADGVAAAPAAAFARTLPADPFRIRLSVYAGRLAARVDHVLLDAAFLVRGEGPRVELRDMRSGREASYAVVRAGDGLLFSFLAAGAGRWHGFPAQVQRALYTTAPFSPLGRRP